MNVVFRQKGTSVFKLRYVPGLKGDKGDKGDTGDVTPEAEAALAAAIAAQLAAETAEGQAETARAGAEAAEVQTGLDATATAADRVQTGLDIVTSAANAAAAADAQEGAETARAGAEAAETQTGLDAAATADDRVQTGLDRVATGEDVVATAADRVQTGLDAVAAEAEADRAASYIQASATSIGGRLTLTSGVPVTTSDVVGATAIYLTPAGTDTTAIYDGTAFRIYTFAETTLTLNTGQHLSGSPYDVFHYWTGSAVGVGTGPAWASTSSRGTGAGTTELELFQGRLVNKVSITLRNGVGSVAVAARQATFGGSFLATANGQTEDSFAKRYLSNFFNPVDRILLRKDPTASWVYSTATLIPANGGNGNNRLTFFHCVADRGVSARAQSTASNSTGTTQVARVGIGVDSTSVDGSFVSAPIIMVGSLQSTAAAYYEGYLGLGLHSLYWLEAGAGADAQTWYGNWTDPTQNGIFGRTVN